jgi:aspartyl/asparaginyl beta-hydroxylase (cupin superfamily)
VSAERKVKDLMTALEESVAAAKAARRAVAAERTGGEDAIRREAEACEEEERERFRKKMRDWRQNGGIPGYNGPRATRDA